MSIRRYLVLTLFSVLTLITFIAAIQGYKQSMSQAEQQFDHQLLDFAHTLLAINSLTMASSDKTFQVTQQSSFAFQVWQGQLLIMKSKNAPLHRIVNTNTNTNKGTDSFIDFSEVNFLQKRWRALVLSQSYNQQHLSDLTIIVAQPLQTQFALTQQLILAAVTPMIIAVVALSILIFIIVTQGLKPLHQLTFELQKRKRMIFHR